MVDVFYYDAFQKTISPEPEGGPLVRHSDYTALEAENERLGSTIEAMEYSDGDASFWRHIAEKNRAALKVTDKWKRDFEDWMKSVPGELSLYQAYHAGRTAALKEKRT